MHARSVTFTCLDAGREARQGGGGGLSAEWAWNGALLPSYAPAALWPNGPSRACGGSWGLCSAWSSQGSGRRTASVTSEGRGGVSGGPPARPYVLLCGSRPIPPCVLSQEESDSGLPTGGEKVPGLVVKKEFVSPFYPHPGTSGKVPPLLDSHFLLCKMGPPKF